MNESVSLTAQRTGHPCTSLCRCPRRARRTRLLKWGCSEGRGEAASPGVSASETHAERSGLAVVHTQGFGVVGAAAAAAVVGEGVGVTAASTGSYISSPFVLPLSTEASLITTPSFSLTLRCTCRRRPRRCTRRTCLCSTGRVRSRLSSWPPRPSTSGLSRELPTPCHLSSALRALLQLQTRRVAVLCDTNSS